MLKFFTDPVSKYARANFMILPTPEGSVLVKGIKMMKILKFVPKSLTYDNQLFFTVIYKMSLRNA